MTIIHEVEALTHGYVRKGGKRNRKQQRARMIGFAKFAAMQGANSLGQIGKRHVLEFWKANRDLSPRTLYGHWRAICILWDLAGKPGEPPRPLSMATQGNLLN